MMNYTDTLMDLLAVLRRFEASDEGDVLADMAAVHAVMKAVEELKAMGVYQRTDGSWFLPKSKR